MGETSFQFDVLIQFRPKLRAPRFDYKSIDWNHDFTLKCPIDGIPEPKFDWHFFNHNKDIVIAEPENYGKLFNGRIVGHDGRSIRIINASADDVGQYICIGSNDLGQASRYFNIELNDKFHWSDWSPYSPCSRTCGAGVSIRTRECFYENGSIAADRGKRKCFGKSKEKRACKIKPCSIDGGWSKWTDWTECRAGRKIRKRKCNNPIPRHYGKNCFGSSIQRAFC